MAGDDDANRRMTYELLHRRARELMAAGQLPRTGPNNIFGGYGSDRICELCAAPINAREIEYELEFFTADESRPKRLVWFHLACHAIWDYERTR
jgi:hypothetical protein